jgi:hypothetical protein
MDLVVRFLVGGTIVSLFALIGDVVKPKGFSGLFGAAPLRGTCDPRPHHRCPRETPCPDGGSIDGCGSRSFLSVRTWVSLFHWEEALQGSACDAGTLVDLGGGCVWALGGLFAMSR